MTRVITTGADTGRSCPYCRFPLKEGTPAERCDGCTALHHEDCWEDCGGCAVLGCVASGKGVATTAAPVTGTEPNWPQGGSYPPGMQDPLQTHIMHSQPGYSVPAGYQVPPQGQSVPQRSGNQAVLFVFVLIALIGIGTGLAVATGAFSKDSHADAPSRSLTPAATTSTIAAGSTPSEQAGDRKAILGILGEYQSAYSDHNISGLAKIFTPGIVRHGLAAGGCTVSRGRGSVLTDYQSQFEAGSGSYELVGLTSSDIELDGKRGTLDAHYLITPGGSGYVNFKFAEAGEGWKISEVYATCE
jgi:hypothetical protein